jgi:hypothetical protein
MPKDIPTFDVVAARAAWDDAADAYERGQTSRE